MSTRTDVDQREGGKIGKEGPAGVEEISLKLGKDGESALGKASGSALMDLMIILKLGWPCCVSQALEMIPGMVMLAFLGSNIEHLSAAGLGYMFGNVTGISFIIGFGAGAQPLVSQAFGSGNYARCGDLLQRQLAIHLLVLVGVALVWLNSESILLAARQPAHISHLSAQFILWRVPALPFLVVKEDLKVYLQAQKNMMTPMMCSIIANGLTILSYSPLIARYGFVGAPLAMTLGNVLQAVLMALLTKRSLQFVEAWPVWSLQTACSEWGEMFALSMPSAALMLAEWWGWEVNLFLAGMLCKGDDACLELDVFPLASSTMVMSFMVHFGFSIAAGTRIGNALGAGDWVTARRTSRVALCLAGSIAGMVALILILLRDRWGYLFSTEEGVVEMTAQVLPYVAAYIFLDALGPGALVQILRSMGVVKLPACLNVTGFYGIGIPFGIWLTFGHKGDESWGIVGLWAGLVLAMSIMVSSLLTYLLTCISWMEVAELAQARSEATSPTKVAKTSVMGMKGRSVYAAIQAKSPVEVTNVPGFVRQDVEEAAELSITNGEQA